MEDEKLIVFINTVTRAVMSSKNITEMLDVVVSELSKKASIDWASLVIIEGENIRFKALSSNIPSLWKEGEVIPLKGTATEYVAKTKQILYRKDLSRESPFWTGKHHLVSGIRAIINAPLIVEDKVFGSLVFASKLPDAFSGVEDLIFHTVTQIAYPVKNTLLIEEIEKRNILLQTIQNLTRIILSDLSLKRIFDEFVKELKKIVSFERASITVLEGEKVKFIAASNDIKIPLKDSIPAKGSYTEWVVKNKKTLIIKDISHEKVFYVDEIKAQAGFRSSIHLPLMYKGEVFGCLNLSSKKTDAYGDWEKSILENLVIQISGAIANSYLYKKLEEESRYDALTRVFNRRYFNERLHEEIKRCERHGGVFSIAVCDIDFFKQYNDRYGHTEGDRVLINIAQIIKDSVRTDDLVFRYGGDEFVILLPDTETEDALKVAERVRRKIEENMKKQSLTLTVSIGVASYPKDAGSSQDLIDCADSLCLFAKKIGGNQVVTHGEIKIRKMKFEIKNEEAVTNITYSLLTALKEKDAYTYIHSKEVQKFAFLLGKEAGLPEEELFLLSRACLLHDIGKIGISDHILHKKASLTETEWEEIKLHPGKGSEIISHIPQLHPCKAGILHHHERWDGKGYPAGLKEKQIPFPARIIAIADAFSAMTSPRLYRPAFSFKEASEELRRCSGTQFDPQLVDVFFKMLDKIT